MFYNLTGTNDCGLVTVFKTNIFQNHTQGCAEEMIYSRRVGQRCFP